MKRKQLIVIAAAAFLGFLLLIAMLGGRREKPKIQPEFDMGKSEEQVLDSGNLLDIQKFYRKQKESIRDMRKLQEIQEKLETVNMKILFSPIIDHCGVKYTVQPKDILFKIARTHGTTVALIQRANNLTSHIIRPGQELKVNTCTFSIVVDKSQNVLLLKVSDNVIKTYTVATGADNATPIGTFKIETKLIDPTWYTSGAIIPPDSEKNILGSRWMGFDMKGYGIHGTRDPDSLGKQATLGCIRMKNLDVEELYDIVPSGTEVTIVD